MNFLFDLYGTLADIHTDENKAELWTKFAALLGEQDGERVKEEYLCICKKHADARAYKFVEFDLLLVFEKMLQNRGIDKSKASFFAREFRVFSREKLKLFPHVLEMLDGLREKGAGVYLVSNAQACFTRDEIDELGLTSHFDGILISSEAGVKKPDGQIFEVAFNRFNINKKECFYVGNDLHDDVLGAKGAGLRTVYIETEQSGKYSELNITPDYIVPTHKAMMELLFSLSEAQK